MNQVSELGFRISDLARRAVRVSPPGGFERAYDLISDFGFDWHYIVTVNSFL
jgi:hypothetical protein